MSDPTSHSQLAQLLDDAIKQLTAVSDSARLDSELLLCHVLKKDRSYLRAWPEYQLSADEKNQFLSLIKQRQQGHPVAHLIGNRGFWTLDLKVTSDTLIPRPDTERLVELALEYIPHDANWHILDLGTGTGAIALSIAKERPTCMVTATDKSDAALVIARENAINNQVSNVRFIQSDWFSALGEETQKFEMIVSNPPYIKEGDPHLTQGDVRFDPMSALTSGEDGLDDIRIIISDSQNYLAKDGIILLEHGYDQENEVCELLHTAGFSQVVDFKDDSNNPRVAIGHYN